MTEAWTVTPRARLVALNTTLQGRAFVVLGSSATLGRSAECEIELDLASVSRQHARLEEREGTFLIRDLGSRNGIKINDQPVAEALLKDGDIITIGDLQLRFETATPPPVPAMSGAARPLTGADILAAAQAGEPPGATPEKGPRAGLNLKMILVVALALAISLVAGALILRRTSRSGAPTQGKVGPVLLRVGENKWISCRRYGDFASSDVIVEDPEVADATRYDKGELVIQGKSGGETDIRLKTSSGAQVSVRVIVRGRIEDPLEELVYGRYTDEERKELAAQFLRNGMLIETEKPYLALQQYEKALAVLRPIKDKPELYLKARERKIQAAKTVDEQWNKLRGDITVAWQNNDRTRQMQLLQEAMKLIPDRNDPRHQKAQWRMQQIVREEMLEKEKRGRR